MIPENSIHSARPDDPDCPVSVMLLYRPPPGMSVLFRSELSQALTALRQVPGCRATVDLCRLGGDADDVCVVVQFDRADVWRNWRESVEWKDRAMRLSRLGGEPVSHEAVGPGASFALPSPPGPPPPPRAKMAVVMWISVYPTITVLLWLLWPLVQGLPMPFRTLALSLVMVPLMVWVIVPWVTARLGPWLKASAR